MSGRHGGSVRGLMSTGGTPGFEGRFGRMFHLDAASFGDDDAQTIANLSALGDAMSADFDPPKDGKDPEESGLPALYTYFGQFVDHDITFDPVSLLQGRSDPDALVDFRTPALDLDNVYGRGPADQPYLYASDGTFLLGDPLSGGGDDGARDLPRNGADPRRAIIGDPRNDENAIVSQLRGLLLRFHNRTLRDDPSLDFDEAQQRVRFHYQWVVANDFLPRLVHSRVLSSLRSGPRYDRDKLRFFRWKDQPFMPVEFSVAAYRVGHSMVRPGYRLNDGVMRPIFPTGSELPEGLTGFRAMNPSWGIDWGRFIDVDVRAYDGSDDDRKRRLQLAYKIDTSLANPLAGLPPSVASNPSSLAQRNLLRGWRLGLPSGQAVARAMGLRPLADEDILLGKATGLDGDATSIVDPALGLSDVFAGNCPLWTYVLAEAMQHAEDVVVPASERPSIATPRLGPVGGRIVAEVILGLLFADESSYFNVDPAWQPDAGASYALKDLVAYALGR